MDQDMIETIAAPGALYMHAHERNTGTMQQLPQYNDVVKEVLDYLILKVKLVRMQV